MVTDLGIIDAGFADGPLFPEHFPGNGGVFAPGHGLHPLCEGGDDVRRQIAGIGAGIGQSLVPLIQALHDVQRLLGAHLIQAVGVPLQFGQVIQHRR